jgi:transcriptional regulator GlxA family with amidase domain
MPLGMTAIENTGRMKATCEMILELEKTREHKHLVNHLLGDLFAQAEAERILIKPYKSGMVAEIRAFFDRHLDERISLERLAQSMRMSPSGLIHRFKK